jgi:hypothetical protein
VLQEHVVDVLNDPLAQELLHSPLVAHLAYDGLDGFPRAIPIGYLWTNGQFVICTPPNAPKVQALKANPKVALTVDTDTMPPHILLVRGTASIEVIDGIPTEYLEASHKAVSPEDFAAFEAQVRALYKQMARIAITPTWAKLIDFETRLPLAVEQLAAQRA